MEKPILNMPDIDWSSTEDIERLFEENNNPQLEQDRPIVGKQLVSLQRSLDSYHGQKGRKLTQTTFRTHMGNLAPNRHNDLTGKRAEETVDPTMAIIMRIYDKYPKLCPPQDSVDISVLEEEGQMTSKRELSILLGKDQVSASRYSPDETRAASRKSPSATTSRLTYLMYLFIRAGKLDEYRRIVSNEGRARGEPNVLSKGWPKREDSEIAAIRKVKTAARKAMKDANIAGNDDAFEYANHVDTVCDSLIRITTDIKVLQSNLADNQVSLEASKSQPRLQKMRNVIEDQIKKIKQEILKQEIQKADYQQVVDEANAKYFS
tara:strand:- start:134547 stop:135506 length:960 start_codon:yes stop_codon:yes gene_type:complete